MMKKYLPILIASLTIAGVAQAQTLYQGKTGQKPLEVAMAYLQDKLPDGYAEGRQVTTLKQERITCTNKQRCLPSAKITFVIDGLEDDSIRAERHILTLEQAQNQPWQIIQKDTTQACRKGRGHTKFSAKPCI
jgi:hypothetical protein